MRDKIDDMELDDSALDEIDTFARERLLHHYGRSATETAGRPRQSEKSARRRNMNPDLERALRKLCACGRKHGLTVSAAVVEYHLDELLKAAAVCVNAGAGQKLRSIQDKLQPGQPKPPRGTRSKTRE